jgi:hypothetical protein
MLKNFEFVIDWITKILWLVLLSRWLWTSFTDGPSQHIFLLY